MSRLERRIWERYQFNPAILDSNLISRIYQEMKRNEPYPELDLDLQKLNSKRISLDICPALKNTQNISLQYCNN